MLLDAAGVATFATSTLTVGTHTVTADYPGNAAFLPSSATPLTQTVNQVVSTTLLVSSLNPSAPSDLVTFTATVTPAAATGTVEFFDGATSLGAPVALSAGTASFSTAALLTGSHPITAVYSGDTNQRRQHEQRGRAGGDPAPDDDKSRRAASTRRLSATT